MPMMTSQILISMDFTKTQKSRYLEHETFFSNKKVVKGYFMAKKKKIVAEVTFKFRIT